MPEEEVNSTEQTQAESPDILGDELKQANARITELENLLETKEQEIASSGNRISELESSVSNLEQTVAASNDNLERLRESLNQTVASYRSLVVQANPDILEELITGDSIEAIDNSLKSAQELIGKVKMNIAAEMASVKVPAGAPQRTPPDLSALSPREKIQYALGRG